jgi:hypothetical protein
VKKHQGGLLSTLLLFAARRRRRRARERKQSEQERESERVCSAPFIMCRERFHKLRRLTLLHKGVFANKPLQRARGCLLLPIEEERDNLQTRQHCLRSHGAILTPLSHALRSAILQCVFRATRLLSSHPQRKMNKFLLREIS